MRRDDRLGKDHQGLGRLYLRHQEVRSCSSSGFHFVGVMLVSCHSAVRLLM